MAIRSAILVFQEDLTANPNSRIDSYFYEAGLAGDGRQVLMGLHCPNLVAIYFDAPGNLMGYEARRLEFLQRGGVLVDGEPIEGAVGSYNIDDPGIPLRFAAWQEELGFRSATIRVKRFFLDEFWIGIEDYPSDFGEVLDDPDASDEEKDDVRNSIRLWDADGQFVLHWGNDYWMDESGEVNSS